MIPFSSGFAEVSVCPFCSSPLYVILSDPLGDRLAYIYCITRRCISYLYRPGIRVQWPNVRVGAIYECHGGLPGVPALTFRN